MQNRQIVLMVQCSSLSTLNSDKYTWIDRLMLTDLHHSLLHSLHILIQIQTYVDFGLHSRQAIRKSVISMNQCSGYT